jgi:hypothetical protein
MAATPTDICNQALGALGTRSQITSMNESGEEARYCRLYYENTRTGLLRGAHWNFARKTAYLSLLKSAPGTPENSDPGTGVWDPVTTPAPPWLYEYAYPADCQQVRYIAPQMNVGGDSGTPIFSSPSYVPIPNVSLVPQRFVVASDTISGEQVNVVLCQQTQAICIYTCDVDNPGLWDSLFQDAMVEALAFRMCFALTGDKTLAAGKQQAALIALKMAQARDGDEGLTVNDHIPDWLRVRGYAGDWSTTGYYCGQWSTPSFLLI